MKMKKIIITIDGPASSGKSTTARLVAQRLGYTYIDTGAMYRAATLYWLRSGKELNEENICSLLETMDVKINIVNSEQRTILNGEDVSDDIRLPDVTKYVSPVSAVGCVREELVELQRKLGKGGASVLDGRDTGTVVFPNADLKIFLVASIEARAMRRKLEFEGKGIFIGLDDMISQITDRDRYDSSREISPLKQAEDAVVIDNSLMTIEQQVESVVDMAIKIMTKKD